MAAGKVEQLQLLQQNLQNLLLQKNQLEMQQTEVTSALAQITDSPHVYKILGKVMVAADKNIIKNELEEKKEMIDVRLKNFQAQEKKIQDNIQKLQKEVVEGFQTK